jgi:hypothetical protein
VHLDLVVKRHHHHTVYVLEFVDKLDRRVLNVVEAVLRGAAGIDQQDNAER